MNMARSAVAADEAQLAIDAAYAAIQHRRDSMQA